MTLLLLPNILTLLDCAADNKRDKDAHHLYVWISLHGTHII